MPSDIAKRLRAEADNDAWTSQRSDLEREAADVIDELRAYIEQLRNEIYRRDQANSMFAKPD